MVDARTYHERTKHSPRSVREDDFQLDFTNQPRPYKVYEELPGVSLSTDRKPTAPTLSVVAESSAEPTVRTDRIDEDERTGGTETSPPDLESLAALCLQSNGVIKTATVDGREMAFRAASCTGKLYHVDLYLVCGDSEGLEAGVYHFDPNEFAFDVLRKGEYRGVVAEAAGGYAPVAEAPVSVVVTSTWWRNAWKYRERTYRHAFWDSGTVLANLLAAAHSFGYRVEVVTGVAEEPLATLLGVDPEREAPLQVVTVGSGATVDDAPPVEPIDPETKPLSDRVVDYPLVVDAWEQSRLGDGEEARTWLETVRNAGEVGRVEAGGGERVSLDPVDDETASDRPLHRTIYRRGSCREFAGEATSGRKVATVLDRATQGIPADWNGGSADESGSGNDESAGDGLQFNDVYCLVSGVEGIPDGSYQFHPSAAALERLGDVDRRTKTHLALDQPWAGEAHVNVYLLADVDAVVDRLGNRGYRLAQLEAGVTLGRLYLATYAHRELGGTGLTFYDDEVTAHLSPRAESQTPTCLFAFGRR